MKVFRLAYLRRLLLLITGITFLNMGFFLVEASALEIESKLFQSITNSVFEEESESGEPSVKDSVTEIDYLNTTTFSHAAILFIVNENRKGVHDDPDANHHHLEVFCPPPEV
jgi:hypothetical protein